MVHGKRRRGCFNRFGTGRAVPLSHLGRKHEFPSITVITLNRHGIYPWLLGTELRRGPGDCGPTVFRLRFAHNLLLRVEYPELCHSSILALFWRRTRGKRLSSLRFQTSKFGFVGCGRIAIPCLHQRHRLHRFRLLSEMSGRARDGGAILGQGFRYA